jgi:hypothetical protein
MRNKITNVYHLSIIFGYTMKPNIQMWQFSIVFFFSLLAIGKLSKSLLFQKNEFLIFLFGKTLPGNFLELFEVATS